MHLLIHLEQICRNKHNSHDIIRDICQYKHTKNVKTDKPARKKHHRILNTIARLERFYVTDMDLNNCTQTLQGKHWIFDSSSAIILVRAAQATLSAHRHPLSYSNIGIVAAGSYTSKHDKYVKYWWIAIALLAFSAWISSNQLS